MEKCAPIDLHAKMCSHWNTCKNVLLLTCITKCAPIGIHGENVLPLTCMQKCAPIGMHLEMCSWQRNFRVKLHFYSEIYSRWVTQRNLHSVSLLSKMCSHWNKWGYVLPLDCTKKMRSWQRNFRIKLHSYSEIYSRWVTQRNLHSVSLLSKMCSYWLYSEHVCSYWPEQWTSIFHSKWQQQYLLLALTQRSRPFSSTFIERNKENKQNLDIQPRGTTIALLAIRSQHILLSTAALPLPTRAERRALIYNTRKNTRAKK